MKGNWQKIAVACLMTCMSFLAAIPVMAVEQHLTVGVAQDPLNWDPMDTYRMAWSAIATSVFEGLVERDVEMNVKPGLATSWDVVQDEKRIRFHLREGVKFHSGDDFKADSVKFTFDRLLAEDSISPQKGNYSAIDEVKIIDDYTVDFILKELDPVLIVKLSGYAGNIVPKAYIEEKGDEYFNTHPVGTGPFKMVNYEPDQKVELERFDGYWKEPLPTLEKVTFRIIPEASTRLAELQTGNIDINDRVEVNQASILEAEEDIELIRSDTPTAFALRFDTFREPTDDVRVREALALAIDVDTIIETVLEGNGRRINSFQSQLSFGYDESLPLRPYDPERAKELLKEAGYDFNQTLTMATDSSNATLKEVFQAIQLYLKQIGVKTKLETVEYNVYFNDLVPNRKAGHMYRQGWGGWTLDFDNTAYSLYQFGQKWCPDYKDEQINELIEAERSTMDPAARKEIFVKMNQRLYETIPDAPLYQRLALWGVHKKVQGFKAPADGRMRFEEVSIAE